MGIEIKQYNEGDEVAICDLFKSAFNKDLSIEYWNWRYRDNPTGIKMISLMWDGDKLAGHYALSPVYVHIDGQKALSGLSMTTMTHPDYRGLGIFPTLAEHLYNEQKELNELQMVWGFPNNNSHYIFSKVLKWKDVEQIPTFSLYLQNFKKPTDSTDIVLSKDIKQGYITTAEEKSDYSFRVEKSEKYLNWRYLENPSSVYEIFELSHQNKLYYAVSKVFKSYDVEGKYEIDIVELNFPEDYKSLVELVSVLIEHYANFDILKINMWCPLSRKSHLLLEKMGFGNQAPITYLGYRSLNKDSRSLVNWQYQMGDSDVY